MGLCGSCLEGLAAARRRQALPPRGGGASEAESSSSPGRARSESRSEAAPCEGFAEELVGRWRYDGFYSYELAREGPGRWRFREQHDSGKCVTGVLAPVGVWLQGGLIFTDTMQSCGTIRLYYSRDLQVVLSSFRGVDQLQWSENIVAHREPLLHTVREESLSLEGSTSDPKDTTPMCSDSADTGGEPMSAQEGDADRGSFLSPELWQSVAEPNVGMQVFSPIPEVPNENERGKAGGLLLPKADVASGENGRGKRAPVSSDSGEEAAKQLKVPTRVRQRLARAGHKRRRGPGSPGSFLPGSAMAEPGDELLSAACAEPQRIALAPAAPPQPRPWLARFFDVHCCRRPSAVDAMPGEDGPLDPASGIVVSVHGSGERCC